MRFFHKSLDRLKSAMKKTRDFMTRNVRTFLPGRQIDESFLTELEATLISADIGVKAAERIVGEIRERWRLAKIKNAADAEAVVREQMAANWPAADRELKFDPAGPTVILVCGVNGAGKTTSIAKLAWLLKEQMGKKVLLCASDTFRAGAVHQLSIWAERLGVEIIKHKQGADPAAVAYDACEAAKSRAVDVLIVDTAGRLPTQEHLIRELVKIRDVVSRRIDGAPMNRCWCSMQPLGRTPFNRQESSATPSTSPASSWPNSTAPPKAASSWPSRNSSTSPSNSSAWERRPKTSKASTPSVSWMPSSANVPKQMREMRDHHGGTETRRRIRLLKLDVRSEGDFVPSLYR